ncbi:nuclear transport factor 2 family protein [Rhodococcus qingshengii]|uniref:nuclear transport factor 2 family protein n=1 Tax=Rhodococcus qingshengii TaxID=334542 RepID=UPI001E4690F6|nr:nuclear transport factor 2 family protein [Rhodococcus qingshengii]MCQ4152403.1 nuclear transport factor 2 family protein [Rhodococcus qingshengii]UGQ55409.1 nuclear transport factor 2 family protein [Rhodococcus qingshengii]
MAVQGQTVDEKSVLEFFDCWDAVDIDRMMSFFTPDAVYIDVPLPQRDSGVEAIRAHISATLEALSLRIETVNISSRDNVVLTERMDYISSRGSDGPSVELPLMGVMEMKNGKIAVWRDYFDLSTLEKGLGVSFT